MTRTFPYACCFCGSPSEVTYEEPEGYRAEFEALLKQFPTKIACDRCGTYERRRRDLSFALLKRAFRFEQMPLDERSLVNAKYRRIFGELVSRLCAAYTDRFCRRVPYDPIIVETLMEQPQKAKLILKGIHQIATT